MKISPFLTFIFLIAYPIALPSISWAQDLEGNTSPTPTEVNSFEMFWPIVAGKTRGDPLYFLKSLKESLRELLIFGEVRKAEYNITLSEKRTVEAEKLIKDGEFENAVKTLRDARKSRDNVFSLLTKKIEAGNSSDDLKSRFRTSLEKQSTLLTYLADNILPKDQALLVNEDLKQIASFSENLQ